MIHSQTWPPERSAAIPGEATASLARRLGDFCSTRMEELYLEPAAAIFAARSRFLGMLAVAMQSAATWSACSTFFFPAVFLQ